ncbi:hypothetical protein CGZ69_01035 [Streptomyces peucetius subsp. caesius ATCC 27952]|nr:hypothetical protein CGZ69_01035 [Streptomyces peucetius subsp. caesius ATCC 27952]
MLCGHHEVTGDVTLSWDVYMHKAPADAPTEPEAALRLAALIGTTVLYPAEGNRPSAYWGAGPDGTVARVRVYERDIPEDDKDTPAKLTVGAAEAYFAQLPAARVMLLPEIYRDELLPVPVADAFAAAVDPGGTAPAESPCNRARECLLLWERLVSRAGSDWALSGRYPLELYLEDLRTRDDLAVRLAAAPPELRGPFVAAAQTLDATFRAATVDDGGRVLADLTGEPVGARGWWWQRRPVRLPWQIV